jgi:putative inorganic carbon (hco3(-)) transporter
MGTGRPLFSERVFLALVASLPVMQPVLLGVATHAIPIADFIFVLAAVAAALDVVLGRRSLPRSRVLGWIALYGTALFASAALSPERGRSFVKFAGDCYLFGLTALVLFHVRSIDALRRALLAWLTGLVVTIVAAFAGLGLFAAGVTDPKRNLTLSIHGSLPEGGYPRVMGLFLNPNMYCAYMVASLALVIAMCRAGWMKPRTAAVVGAAVAAAAFWSLSPGLGGLLLVVAFAAWTKWKDSWPGLARAAVIAGVAGAAAFLGAATVSPQPGSSLLVGPLRASSRVLASVGALRTVPAHPWFGKGLGLEVVDIGYRNPSGIYELLTDAHNTWLSILAQSGLFGLVTFVALVVALLRGASLHASASPLDRVRSGVTMAFAAGFLYQSLTGSFENTRHVWVLIGLLASTGTSSTLDKTP